MEQGSQGKGIGMEDSLLKADPDVDRQVSRSQPGIILLAVQGERMASVFEAYLEQDGYTVHQAREVAQALETAFWVLPDLVLLDQRLLPTDQVGRLSRFQGLAGTALILLIQPDRMDGEIRGFDSSEVIVVARPLRPRAVSALVRKTLQLAGGHVPRARVYQAGELTLDRDRHTLQVADRFIDLTLNEFDLLSLLMSAPGKVFLRAELLDWVSGPEGGGAERTIDVHVRNLRLKLGGQAKSASVIETVYGAGYRFVPQHDH